MALKAILDAVEGLPADVAKEYKKRDDGKFELDVTPVDGLQLANVTNLQSALSKERENARSASDKLRVFEGIDPDKARDALKKVEQMASWSSDEKVKQQIEAIKKQMTEAHGEELAKLNTKLQVIGTALEAAKIDAVATQALTEQKGSVRLLMPHIRALTRLREADGSYVVEVMDSNGNPRLHGTDGHAMTIGELVAEMKGQDDFASAFEGTGASGTGASGSNGHRGNQRFNAEELAKLSPVERIKHAEQAGITK